MPGTGIEVSHAFHGLNWRVLKPGNRVQGKRRYESQAIMASDFTAKCLDQSYAKNIPEKSTNKIMFIGK